MVMLHNDILPIKSDLLFAMLYEQQLSIAMIYYSAPIITLLLLSFLGVALHIAVYMAINVCTVPVT